MDKDDYMAYFPKLEISKPVRCNPAHMKQMCIILLNEYNTTVVFIQNPTINTFDTELICVFEEDELKFYTLDSKIDLKS